ncbi:TPA: MFS transporter [Staphylococcus aureus]|nr:MFS transporter [Staphylococcus aureus]HCQ3510372.1 MFS transporter [Staphylococcus aureus]HCQ3513152.1 MFS transporter [Staphylococcus aureus]HCQ3515931.1 MFS transporter [Staphylococcus aureus]
MLVTKKAKIIELFIISVLTIIGIGSQFFSNLAYSLNQGILQTSFGIGSKQLIIPSIIGNFMFALGVPFGHIFAHKFGTKKIALFFLFSFFIGSIIGILSFDIFSLSLAKIIQGFSTGILFFTLLPKLFLSFPKRFKNVFLLIVIIGLFGANALGGVSGSLSLELDKWKWIFIINIISSLLCFILGVFFIEDDKGTVSRFDKFNYLPMLFLIFSTIFLTLPMIMITQKSRLDFNMIVFLLISFLFFVNFVYTNSKSEDPIIFLSSLFHKKPMIGSFMAISSHLTLLTGIAGINVFLMKALKLPFDITMKFYFFFLLGVIITGFIKMFFYSSLGAGILGTLGSISILYLTIHWLTINSNINIHLLYVQGILLGFGTSMTLLSGAMATLLDGDLKYASNRSITMHTIRNYLSAILVPLITYLLSTSIQESIQSLYSNYTFTVFNKLVWIKKMQDIVIQSDRQIFVLMFIFNLVMLISSIIQIILGKGRRITPK